MHQPIMYLHPRHHHHTTPPQPMETCQNIRLPTVTIQAEGNTDRLENNRPLPNTQTGGILVEAEVEEAVGAVKTGSISPLRPCFPPPNHRLLRQGVRSTDREVTTPTRKGWIGHNLSQDKQEVRMHRLQLQLPLRR